MIQFSSEDRFLVTGASSGIGESTAHELVRLGATVIGVARSMERLQAARARSAHPERFHIEVRDLGQDVSVLTEWVRATAETYGPLRGLVHAAGLYSVVPLKVLDIEEVRRIFEVNVFAGLALAKGFARKNVFAVSGSSILLFSSISSMRGFSGVAAYAASKGAVNATVRSLAHELGRQKIRVNAVMPGVIDTEMTRRAPPEQTEYLVARQPLGIGKPEDVAHLAAFLLSDCARFITGQCIAVDGGGSL